MPSFIFIIQRYVPAAYILANLGQVHAVLNNSQKARERYSESLKLLEEGGAAGEDSLFGKAEKSESTEEIVTNVQGMVDAYNNTLDQLKNTEGELNKFYMDELKTYVSDHREALSAAGVTAGADGKLVIDEEKLKNADLETLKKAFGSTSGFTDKVGFIAGRVSENASASEYAFLNQYNEKGIANLESYVANHYNFWG